jgi:RES domain-containing protein
VPCIYTSTHISLAILETLANKRWHTVPGLCLVTLELADAAPVRSVAMNQLSPYWQIPVPYDISTIAFGTDFLRKGIEAALQVPSALVPQEFNLILSPHRAAAVGLRVVSVEAFALDTRLVV